MDGIRPLFSGRTDQNDWLVEAGIPLTALQASAGGVVPGPIHIPAVLEAVRQARSLSMPIKRTITVRGERGRISSLIQVEPDVSGVGCAVDFLSWQEAVPISLEGRGGERPSNSAIRLFSELLLQVDREDRVISVQDFGTDTRQAAATFMANKTNPWQHCVEFDPPRKGGEADCGADVITLAGSPRRWVSHALPGENGCFRQIAFLPLLSTGEGETDEAHPEQNSLLSEELVPVLAQPVARIIANSRTIGSQLAGPISPNYARYAEDIAMSGEYLLSMLEDLSELDAASADQYKIISESVNLIEVAKTAYEMLSATAQKRQITINVEGAATVIKAVGDRRRVLQIVINLLTNAIRYSPLGSSINVFAWSDGSTASLSVSDEGAGIEEAALPLVFEKFERLGRTGDGGTGLGLYISRRLARAMNGELSVTSTLGKGAEFSLTLAKDRRQA